MEIEEFAGQMGWTVAEAQHLNDVAGENELEEVELMQRCKEVEQFISQKEGIRVNH